MRFTHLAAAAAVASAICLIGAGFVVYTHSSLTKQLRKGVKQMAAEGKLPAELEGVDLDEITLDGFGVELSRGDLLRVSIADALSSFWFVCIPLVFGISIGVGVLAQLSFVELPVRSSASGRGRRRPSGPPVRPR